MGAKKGENRLTVSFFIKAIKNGEGLKSQGSLNMPYGRVKKGVCLLFVSMRVLYRSIERVKNPHGTHTPFGNGGYSIRKASGWLSVAPQASQREQCSKPRGEYGVEGYRWEKRTLFL